MASKIVKIRVKKRRPEVSGQLQGETLQPSPIPPPEPLVPFDANTRTNMALVRRETLLMSGQDTQKIDKQLAVATSMYNEEFMRVKTELQEKLLNPEFIDMLADMMVDIEALHSFTKGMFRDGKKARGDAYDATKMIQKILIEIFADSKGQYRVRNNLYMDRAYDAGIIT